MLIIMLPAYLKKKEDTIPWAALFTIKRMVAFECPCKISKLSGPGKNNHMEIRVFCDWLT